MDDAEFVRWLEEGSVIVVGTVSSVPERENTVVRALAAWRELKASYWPCEAISPQLCRYCPWEYCRGGIDPDELL